MKKWYKICPYCGNEIKELAIKCQYCKEFLNNWNESKKNSKQPEEKKIIKKDLDKPKKIIESKKDKQDLLKKIEKEWKVVSYFKNIDYKWLFVLMFLLWITLLAFDFFHDELRYYRLHWNQTIMNWTSYYYNKVEFIRYCIFLLWWYFIYEIIKVFYKVKNEFAKFWLYILSLTIFHLITISIVQYYDWLIYFLSPWNFFGQFLYVTTALINLF